MAKPLAGLGVKSKFELPRVELEPVTMSKEDYQIKMDDVQRLVAQIIALSHKRGRKNKNYDQEEKYAA